MFMKLLSMLKLRLMSAPVERKQFLCWPLANASIAQASTAVVVAGV